MAAPAWRMDKDCTRSSRMGKRTAGPSRSSGGVEKFVSLDLGGNAGLAVLRGLGADNQAVAADVDVARARDLFRKRDDEFDRRAHLDLRFGEEVQTAIADVAGEGFEFARIRIERENSHRQGHVKAAGFAAVCSVGHTAPCSSIKRRQKLSSAQVAPQREIPRI